METKYENPISPVEMVRIPKWEYAKLIQRSTTMDNMVAIFKRMSEYQWRDAAKVLLNIEEEDEE